ncbi:MAG: 16S rRNA (guanine(966)-N(2))-methyltransferase RsmD [Acholeplasmatales bacterium]|nr:16S rRNA (guanine(966)-N(2))-methyltransferase RsmD [Acholeplasmatales bacterium]
MRIISGKYRGKKIDIVGIDSTRETQDKIRGAIFNSIYPYTNNLKVGLDLFSGSGAMGIEGLSRFLDTCYFNDLNKEAYKTTKKNIDACKIDNYKIYNLDYKECLNELKNVKFDCIFLDPPYKLEVISDIINYVLSNNMLNKDGLIVCEYEFNFYFNDSKLEIIKEKSYGYKNVKIYMLKE